MYCFFYVSWLYFNVYVLIPGTFTSATFLFKLANDVMASVMLRSISGSRPSVVVVVGGGYEDAPPLPLKDDDASLSPGDYFQGETKKSRASR